MVKFIIFDHTNYFKSNLETRFDPNDIYSLGTFGLRNILLQLNNFNDNQKLIILINLNVIIEDIKNFQHVFQKNNNSYSEFNGIDLLIWLRINGYFQHCILYSFVSVDKILKMYPDKTIICSPGTSFFQLPFEPIIESLDRLRSVANAEELKPFLRSAFRFEEYRHEHANWWGIRQLFYVHYNFEKGVFKDIDKSSFSSKKPCM